MTLVAARPAELSPQEISALLDQSLVGVYVFQDGHFKFVNDKAAEILGYGPDELLTVPSLSLVHEADRELVRENVGRRLRGEAESIRYGFRAVRKDGRVIEVEVHGRRVLHEGRPAIASVLLDVSDRKESERRLAAAEARFRGILEGVRDIVVTTDAQGRWTYLSPSWTEITGFAVEECLGRPALDFVHPLDRAEDAPGLAALFAGAGEMRRHDLRLMTSDGRARLMEIHARPMPNGGGGLCGSLRDVGAERAAREAVSDSERRLREITSVLAEGVYVVDADDRVVFMNPAAERLLGWSVDDLMGKSAHALFHHSRPDGTEVSLDDCPVHQAVAVGRDFQSPVEHFARGDGSWLPVSLNAAPIVRAGEVVGSVAAFHDITKRLEYQRSLADRERRYRALFNGSSDAIFVYPLAEGGRAGRFVEVNDVACTRLGYLREELLAMTADDIGEAGPDRAAIDASLRGEGRALFETVHVARDGGRIPVEVNAHLITLDDREMVLSVARDITERKQAQERIRHLAHYDILTDLPNRHLLLDRLGQAIEQARRHDRALAVLFLDLDGFKQINDTHGHEAGDHMLKVVAARMTECVRKADTVARLAGDEFVVLLTEISDIDAARAVAAKLVEAVRRPVPFEGEELVVGASIGISMFPNHGVMCDDLLRCADDAMYEAKRAGKNRFVVYGG